MARYCSPQLSVRTRLSPPYRVTIRLKVFQGRNSISWAKSVLPVFIGDSRDHPGSLLRLQIVDTAFCSETRRTPGAQSRSPSVNRTAVMCWTERLRRGSITAEARPNTRATTTPSHTHVDLHRPLRRLSCSCAHPARTHTAVGQTPDLSALSFALASVPPVASWLLLWLAPTLRRF